MKLPMALKQYFEGDMHVQGSPIALIELKPFILDKESREDFMTELRSYGFEVEE